MTSFNWKTSKSLIIYGCSCLDRNNCHGCSRYEQHKTNVYPPPKTNADRIRAMSDEKLADWVWGIESAGRAYGPRGKNAWLDWLEKEADE